MTNLELWKKLIAAIKDSTMWVKSRKPSSKAVIQYLLKSAITTNEHLKLAEANPLLLPQEILDPLRDHFKSFSRNTTYPTLRDFVGDMYGYNKQLPEDERSNNFYYAREDIENRINNLWKEYLDYRNDIPDKEMLGVLGTTQEIERMMQFILFEVPEFDSKDDFSTGHKYSIIRDRILSEIEESLSTDGYIIINAPVGYGKKYVTKQYIETKWYSNSHKGFIKWITSPYERSNIQNILDVEPCNTKEYSGLTGLSAIPSHILLNTKDLLIVIQCPSISDQGVQFIKEHIQREGARLIILTNALEDNSSVFTLPSLTIPEIRGLYNKINKDLSSLISDNQLTSIAEYCNNSIEHIKLIGMGLSNMVKQSNNPSEAIAGFVNSLATIGDYSEMKYINYDFGDGKRSKLLFPTIVCRMIIPKEMQENAGHAHNLLVLSFFARNPISRQSIVELCDSNSTISILDTIDEAKKIGLITISENDSITMSALNADVLWKTLYPQPDRSSESTKRNLKTKTPFVELKHELEQFENTLNQGFFSHNTYKSIYLCTLSILYRVREFISEKRGFSESEWKQFWRLSYSVAVFFLRFGNARDIPKVTSLIFQYKTLANEYQKTYADIYVWDIVIDIANGNVPIESMDRSLSLLSEGRSICFDITEVLINIVFQQRLLRILLLSTQGLNVLMDEQRLRIVCKSSVNHNYYGILLNIYQAFRYNDRQKFYVYTSSLDSFADNNIFESTLCREARAYAAFFRVFNLLCYSGNPHEYEMLQYDVATLSTLISDNHYPQNTVLICHLGLFYGYIIMRDREKILWYLNLFKSYFLDACYFVEEKYKEVILTGLEKTIQDMISSSQEKKNDQPV